MVNFKGKLASEGIFIQLFFFGTITLFTTLLAGLIAKIFFGQANELPELWWVQTIGAVLAFAVPALIMAFLMQKPDEEAFLRIKKTDGQQLLLAVLIIVSAMPFINLITLWNSGLTLPDSLAPLEKLMRELQIKNEEIYETFLSAGTVWGLIANLFCLALVPAVCEELFFRGALQGIFEKKLNVHISVWLTAVIFSLLHFQVFGFVPRVLLGAALGYMLVFSGSLYLPIAAHFTNNAVIVAGNFMVKKYALGDEKTLDNIGTNGQWWISILGIAICFALFFLLKSKNGER